MLINYTKKHMNVKKKEVNSRNKITATVNI